MGAEAEFRETESGLVTKARSLDSLFTSLERLATTLSMQCPKLGYFQLKGVVFQREFVHA